MEKTESVDLIILGGGIAGLWTLNRAVKAGFNAILFEQHTLGGGQSIHSQGIIHGGVKYALHGALTPASNSIKEMPAIWRSCLDGNGQMDLSKARVLSDAHYLWSQKSIGGRLATFFASKALRGRVDDVAESERPAVFRNSGFKGTLYKLNELVLDVPTVIAALAEAVKERIFKAGPGDYQFVIESGNIAGIRLGNINGNGSYITTKTVVATCGEGAANLPLPELPTMQLRPLHMAMVKHSSQLPLYAHCFSGGTRPLVTVTTHYTCNGEPVWYLGGELAEQGVERGEAEQTAAAKQSLQTLLPWVSLENPQWQTVRINRAEPAQSTLTLPDAAFAKQHKNLIVAWPTKLALAPDLADKVLTMLPPASGGTAPASLGTLPRPAVTQAIWDRGRWTP